MLTEHQKLQLRWETFNVTNSAIFSVSSLSLTDNSSSSFGKILEYADPAAADAVRDALYLVVGSPGPHRSADRKFDRQSATFIALALAVVVFAIYFQVRNFAFIGYDDPEFVVNNPHIRGGLTPASILWAFRTGYAANWFPLTWLSYMAGVDLYGLASGWHHLTNVFLHALNTILLFLLLRRMTGARWRERIRRAAVCRPSPACGTGRLGRRTQRGVVRPVLVSVDRRLSELRRAAAHCGVPAPGSGLCLRPDVEAHDRDAAVRAAAARFLAAAALANHPASPPDPRKSCRLWRSPRPLRQSLWWCSMAPEPSPRWRRCPFSFRLENALVSYLAYHLSVFLAGQVGRPLSLRDRSSRLAGDRSRSGSRGHYGAGDLRAQAAALPPRLDGSGSPARWSR